MGRGVQKWGKGRQGISRVKKNKTSALLVLLFTANIFVLQGGNTEISWDSLKEKGVLVATTMFLIIFSTFQDFLLWSTYVFYLIMYTPVSSVTLVYWSSCISHYVGHHLHHVFFYILHLYVYLLNS